MESTEVNCSENSAIQETTTTITTATSTTIVNKITTDKTTTEDHYDIPNNQTEVLTKTTHSDTCNNNDLQSNVNSYENTLTESKVSVDEVENSQDLNKTNTGITIIRDETMNPHIDTFKSEVIPMNTDVSTENTDEVKMKKDKTHMETSEQLQQNSLKNNEDIKTEVELSFTKNSPDISTRNNSSINQSNENYITAHEESVVNNDKDDDKNSPKHPHRPPPPKLSQTKHTSGSLSYSGGENDELTSKNDNSQIDNNNNYETNPKTSLKQQQNDQQKPQYKRPSMKSNIKHVFTNLRKSFKRKDKPSVKRVVSNHDDVENKYTYNSQQPMTTHSYYNNSNNYNDHRNKQSNSLSSSTPHQYYRNSNEIQENQSQLSNEQSLNISITDSLQQLKRPEEDLDIVYSTELIAPPAIPTKMSSDPNNPIYVNHSIKPNRPPNIDRKENDYTDYPTRPRLYQPTYQSATLSFNEYDHHYNNGTLKPRRPKIITERYKCSEVYNWPPKFPKLKRRKTNPPKQIHTAQDHIVIKQQLKTSAENNHSSPVQHTQSNTEQIQCIKVNNQYQSPNGKRELSVSPEPQVTSLHSLQRSTLLEKSNRTSGTETRDQLFIADYKLAPNNQIGSTKPDSLALPYFAKMTENKRFSKFHYNTTTNNNTSNNNNNNIAVSAEVMRSESPKSSTTLKDALKIMHPLFQCLQDKQPTTSSSPTDNHESQNSKLLIDCLSEYLFTCMKLRSLDLQGEFATFVFPLKNFNEQVWNKYGIIDNWNEISIVCAPNTNYEYVVLNTAKESAQKIRFPTKTIDKLLTNWLDNQTTKTPSPENRHSMEKKNNTEKTSDNKLLHSISLAVTLKSLLNLFEKHKEESKAEAESGEQQHQHHHHEQQQCVDLFLTCIKLNVLLSLSECLDKDKSIQLDLIPEHILLILTPSNCLTIFKQYEKDKLPNTDSNHNEVILKETNLQCLLDALHIQSHSMNDSINDVLKQFYEIIQHNYQSKEMIISLLKSIAPPDWITMCVARICLYNQTNS
uniref:DH domain-containing protein n=1 Tax=Schistosoma mansoni TaxID=6183 RepID=A0A5K4EUL8_SCHMA